MTESPQTRFIPSGGMSRTIAGAVKMFMGIALHLVVRVTGWAIPDNQQVDIIEDVSILIILALEIWGGTQVIRARKSRGDLNWTGHRVAPVEVIVHPDPAQTQASPPPA